MIRGERKPGACAPWLAMVILLGVVQAQAAVGEWRSYTSKREVLGVAMDSRSLTLWAATSGGMFSRDSAGTFHQFTTSEGLKTTALSAIVIDTAGIVWIGAENGFLHSYNPKTGDWQYISDLADSPDPDKRINALRVSGDTLFILSNVGLSMYSISRQQFGDTYRLFGAPPNQLSGGVTSVEMFGGNLWVGTRSGIASTLLSTPNPSAPEAWQVYTTGQGLPSNTISALSVLDTVLLAGTTSGLAALHGNLWNIVPGTAGLNVIGLSGPYERVFQPMGLDTIINFVTQKEVWTYLPSGIVQRIDSTFPYTITAMSPEGLLGTINKGVIFYLYWNDRGQFPPGIGAIYAPPGPPSNKFIGLAVDQRGVVWSGTGTSGADGFMSFDGNRWRSYTVGQDARLGSDNYYKVSIGRNDTKWISNWGVGVALLDDQGELQKTFSIANGLPPTLTPPENQSYVVVGGVATDNNGVAWIASRTPPGDTALVTARPDLSLGYVTGFSTRVPYVSFTDIVIDFNGTKWFTNFGRFEPSVPNRSTGLYYYNEHAILPGGSGNWGKLIQQDGLTSENIYSLAVDRDGALWIGTDNGITIMFDPSNPRGSILPYHPLQQSTQLIQAIVVDPINNKWIGTKQGVFVYSSDGTAILDHYTVKSTDGKLLDDDVASIAINPTAGTVYFGTEKGLSSLSTYAVSPTRSFEELTFSPNPFYLPSTVSLTVSGLVQGSTLKILSIDGGLLREIQTPGGGIGFWDGKDEHGNLASTGVYLVVGYSEDGTKVATGKIAVIRR